MSRQLTAASLLCSLLVCMTASNCKAQITITRLPKDGTWARYEVVSTSKVFSADDDEALGEEITVRGAMTLRSVGAEYIDMIPYRWIEMETRLKTTSDGVEFPNPDETLFVVKALVPEQELSQGKPFPGKIKKMFVLHQIDGPFQAEEIDPSSPQGKQFVASISMPDESSSSPIASIEIESGIGKLKCSGVNHTSLSAENSDDRVDEVVEEIVEDEEEKEGETKGDKNEGVKAKDAEHSDEVDETDEDSEKGKPVESEVFKSSFDMYFSDESPFGLVKSKGTINLLKNDTEVPFATMEVTLKAVGTDAESAIRTDK